jgi:hypothetical protein
VGRAGVGKPVGQRRPYLCHTLCELGAEPLDEQFAIIRRSLTADPREVVLLFVEPYVGVDVVEKALRDTGLLREAPAIDRHDPLPTLGALVRFPPSVTRNQAIGGAFLRTRLGRCERARDRLPNLVAVDFYERTGVVDAVRRLNQEQP